MHWKELLAAEIENTYAVTDRLLRLVEDGDLEWKPPAGSNWMTAGQLLMHLGMACGAPMRGFVTGDWGLPEDAEMGDQPPAEKLPTVASVAEARQLVAEDKRVALEALALSSEDDLENKSAPAPWDPTGMVLGHRFLQMVDHLKQHKGQLFYYLKLEGKPVSTPDLWGS
jgi:uncharacterized damage-inducible protein DinB